MPNFDATAISALDSSEVIQPAFFCWLDILGDPLRATTWSSDVTFAGTGDADLDGNTFLAIDPTVAEVSTVQHREGGSDSVTVSLSGLLLPDADLLATIGDRANWQGRPARLWMRIHDETGTAQGAVAAYYTGYMMALEIVPAADSQTIRITIENYLALLSAPSNRTYLDQERYDSGDLSAKATIGAANGAKAGPAFGVGGSFGNPYGGGDGGGAFRDGFALP